MSKVRAVNPSAEDPTKDSVYAYSGVKYTPTVGTTDLPLVTHGGDPIPYMERDHIEVWWSIDNFTTATKLARPTEYDFTTNGTAVRLVSPSMAGEKYILRRVTPLDPYISFADGAQLTAQQLNRLARVNLYRDQEIYDGLGSVRSGGITSVAGAAPPTDLSYNAATRLLSSSTGADVTLPEANTTAAGLATPAQIGNIDATINRTNSLQQELNNLFRADPQTWSAGNWPNGSVVQHLGHTWVAPHGASGIPGTDPSWRDVSIDIAGGLAHLAHDELDDLFRASPDLWNNTSAYVANSTTRHGGRTWVAASAAAAGEEPGTSAKWRELTLEAIEAKASNAVQSTDIRTMVKLTQAAYDALATKDAATAYWIVG